MTESRASRPERTTDTSGWWSTELQVWWREFDELGHMTAAAYAAAYEEGAGRFVVERWATMTPSFVTAETIISYLHEVRRARLPLTVFVHAEEIGRRSFVLRMVMCDADLTQCSVARTLYVAWDREGRGSRDLTTSERHALQ